MSFPVYIEIGSYKILLHTVLEIAAMFVGFRYFLYLRKIKGDTIVSENRTWILTGAIFGALAGSRLVGGFEDPPGLFHAGNPLLYIYENKTVVGGFLGGLFGVELIKRMVGEKRSSGDLFTYPMILALMIGRVGCFSMGVYEETYGSATKSFTGMDLGDGLLRHPVALYEIVFLFFLWFIIAQVERRCILEEGAKFKIFMISYLVYRFILDFIKPHFTYNFGLSTIQIVCLAGLTWYYKFIFHPKKLLKANAGAPLYIL